MGTRSIIHIKDEKTTIATIYRQYDGYPAGMGEDIKKLLNNGQVKILNGYSGGDTIPSSFNGASCLAAFLVGALKDSKIGNVYLLKPNTKNMGEEYIYTLTVSKLGVSLKVRDVWNKKTLFNGPLSKFCGDKAEGRSSLEVSLS